LKRIRQFAGVLLVAVAVVSLGASLFAPANYSTQFRDDSPNAGPSHQHWLGTDDLGRDRFSRVLYGTRVSLLLAPTAALLSTLLAALVGAIAGYFGGTWEKLAMAGTDLFLSLPWLFLLLMVRAMLPLNISAFASVAVTFLLLGLLGWAASARVICAGARAIRNSDFVLLARASGISRARLLMLHVLPNLKPGLLAQFWISIPVFILTEANLGVLGLGVTEPLPSWGSLLRELESYANFSNEYWRLVPLLLLVITVTSFQLILTRDEAAA